MSFEAETVESYSVSVADHVAGGARLLAQLSAGGVDLLAFKTTALPERGARFTLVPKDSAVMVAAARSAGVELHGPIPAILVRGGEVPGALGQIYERLATARITVAESIGIAHVNRGYGVVLYVEPRDAGRTLAALKP